jgi:hypothetical protein
MKQLNKPSDNLGGLLKIWAVPPSDITIGINSVSLSTEDNIIAMYCSPGSMSFTEKESTGKAGTSYKTELNGFIPKDSEEARTIIKGMTGRKWVVIYLDQNEQYKCAGTAGVPLRVAFDLDTGSDTPERNGHTVSFFGKQLSKAIFIQNPFTV